MPKTRQQMSREIYQRHRSRLLKKQKDVPCKDCDKRFPYYVMDFDHVQGTKEFGIATKYMSVSLRRLLAEIDKCDVVCANCHRIRTHSWRRHG